MAITGRIFQAQEGDFLIAVRTATLLELAALALIVYFFVKREAGPLAACLAAALTVLSPRIFGNALLATYDIPLALFWVAATVAFYRGMTSRAWAIASGFVFGLALLTKENAFLLPLVLWPWGLYFYRRQSIPAILSTALIGPLVFYAGWPWLWQHPIANVARYIADKFPAGHAPAFLAALAGRSGFAWRETISTLYFGHADPGGPAWHYPLVMTLITMPLAVLAGIFAAVPAARREEPLRPFFALLAWSALAQLLVFAFVSKPYDGVRLFLPVLVLAAAAAGIGLARVASRGRVALVAVIVVVALSPGAEFFVYEPWGLSYYSPLVGGLPGAEKLGLEVTYYGEAVDAKGLAVINARAAEGQTVAYGPMFKNIPNLMPEQYIKYTLLNGASNPSRASGNWDYLIFVNRGGQITPEDRAELARGRVIHENRLLGVMLAEILERRADAPAEGINASGTIELDGIRVDVIEGGAIWSTEGRRSASCPSRCGAR